MQKVLPSIHLLEVFMPIVKNEQFFIDEVVQRIPDIPFYKGMETGILMESNCRKKLRSIVERQKYQLTVWLSPYITDYGFNLCSLDKDLRKKSVERVIEAMKIASEMGPTHLGIPSGPYPGKENEKAALAALTDSYRTMLDAIKEYPEMDFTFEPLDRFAQKKQLLGPIQEVADVFEELRKEGYQQIYIHWDSAHEVLNGNDLMKSLEIASPYLAQIHMCNCVADPKHPYYGDWHMDVGQPPEFKNWGYLTPEVGAQMVKKLASFDTNKGIKNTFCTLEIRSAMGNDLWAKEQLVRSFLQRVFDLAGMPYDK